METTNTGCSVADMAALLNNGGGCNNWMNNPFMYLIWLSYMGNGGFGFGNRAGAGIEVNDRLNSLQSQIANNQQTNTLGAGIAGNHEALHGVHGAIDLGFAGTTSAINNASMQNVIGQKDMAAQMASCCCDIKSNILNQTNQLQSQIAQLANGVQTGFAQVGFLTQQQTNELNTNANANTQRILDKMCTSETQNLRDKLAQASQDSQTAQLIAALKTT